MQARIAPAVLVLVASFAAIEGACAHTEGKQVLPPVVVGMLDTTAPAYDDGQTQIYEVMKDVKLPFRQAQDGERPQGDVDPYPDAPFHITQNSQVTIRFTLSNLDTAQHDVDLLIDPWNEFVRYVPGVSQGPEPGQVVPNFSGIQKSFVLPPQGRIEGILTPDDVLELAIDLTVAMALKKRPPDAKGQFGGAALYNRTFNIQNRSTEPDPVLAPWMPASRADIAAVIGFTAGLRTEEKAKIALELVVDVDDLKGDRVLTDGDPDNPKLLGRPGTVLTPPAGVVQ
jgi:hypothetical protein